MNALQKFRQSQPDSSQLTAHSSQLTAHSSQLTAHSSQLTLKLKGRSQKIKSHFIVMLNLFQHLIQRSRIRQLADGMTRKRLPRPSLRSLLAMTLLLSMLLHSLFIVPASVYAASSPWSQTNWAGGSGQTSWSDTTKYSSGSSVNTSTANQVTLTQTSNWYNASWAYRKKITFDNSAQVENLTNFPVLVKLSSSNFDFSKAQSAGQDIRFTDSDGTTALSYEIESYSNAGSTANIWVKVPQIDASSAIDNIYIYYGNSSATDGQAATSVWDSNYKLVQHLKETSGTTTSDSTSNGNNGTKVSATEPNPTTSGQINGAQTFDGTNDKITITDSNSLDLTTSLTIESWVNPTSIPTTFNPIVAKLWSSTHASPYGAYIFGFYKVGTDVKLHLRLSENSSTSNIAEVTANGLTTGSLHQVSLTWDGTNAKFYLDGSQVSTAQSLSTTIGTTNFDLLIGKTLASNENLPGVIDEVRISNTARSAAYIAATYKSESNTFNTFASEEQQYPSSGTLTSSIFDSDFTGGAVWGTLTFAATTPTSTTATVKVRTSNSSSMTGATAFSACDAITSGTDISSNNCVTDSHRYAQYLITLGTSAPASTPTFTSYSLAFAAYDSDAPSISLTAVSSPTSNTKPPVSGTATDTIGTVSNVQFQMDSTSGSWTACTATDGSFNSASEAFTCTPSTALSDGSHIMYVRATDSNGNTTASASYSSTSFTVDATAPVSIDLDSPGDNSHTNNERPSFKWKATTDATAGLSKYVLEIDNPSIGSSQPSGDFTIDSIPTSRTTNYETNKYIIKYENFSDSDSTNNYISVSTKSHSNWSASENDGKLREGRVSWKVKAVDNAGNETSSSRTLFVDRSSPKAEFTQINEIATSQAPRNDGGGAGISTTDITPTIYGKITDSLAGGDSGQSQNDNGPKVASGPKNVEIKIEKKEGALFASTNKLITLYTINMDKPYYTCDGKELSDNSKHKCDKYVSFQYTPKETLELGTYIVTIIGKDKADNTSSAVSFTLNITTLDKLTTPEEKKVIEEELKDLPKEQQEEIKKELEITKPTETPKPNILEQAGEGTINVTKNVVSSVGNGVTAVITGIGNGISATANAIGSAVAFTSSVIASGSEAISNTIKIATSAIGNGFLAMTNTVGQGYNHIANNAPGVAKNIMLAVGSGVSATGDFVGDTASNIGTGISNTGNAIAQGFNTAKNATGNTIANIAFTVGQKTEDISHEAGTAIIKFGYLFVPEPTKIYEVKVLVVSPTSAKVYWKTNHPANGKVNYGLDETYPFDVQTEKRTNNHEFTLTNLKPDTEYHFEVMSQNRNYVYDANRKFRTPK